MKIYLDLLPEERKQEIKRNKIFRLVLLEELLFLLPVVVFIFILLNIYYIITLQRNSFASTFFTEQSQSKYKQLSLYEEKFKKVNDIDKALVKIQSGHLYWQKFFTELSGLTPDGVYITDLSTKNYNVYLLGKAKTREDLLNFKSKLEASLCFQNVDVPLSNLVVKENVDFQIDLKLKIDCLKNEE